MPPSPQVEPPLSATLSPVPNLLPVPSLAPVWDTLDAGATGDGALELRRLIRAGRIDGHTSARAAGYVQGNVVILPAAYAADFERFCRGNPQACPLLAATRPTGRPVQERTSIAEVWRGDLVTFVIGCSFTFERALIAGGIPLRHVAEGRNVAMYRTSVPTVQAGRFGGPLVVSMRPIAQADATRAVDITGRFPDMHGRPVHVGDPAALGIADLSRPDYGDPVAVLPGEVPVFWACGVTSQAAAEAAGLPWFLAHAPGCMLVTDLRHPAG